MFVYWFLTQVGFDSVFFGRIDYQDREKRKGDKSLEVIWRGSKSLGSSSQIFAGAFPKNYEPPPGGFYYEITDDSPVVQVFSLSLAADYYFSSCIYSVSYDKIGS